MTDRPILFSGSMVRALLEGRKTQTRRVVTPGTVTVLGSRTKVSSPMWRGLNFRSTQIGKEPMGGSGPVLNVPWQHPDDKESGVLWDGSWYRVRPIIEKGDRLYVREAWRTMGEYNNQKPSDLIPQLSPIWYEADNGNQRLPLTNGKFRQGMHMPRWASRLTLVVADVRVQRLQDIDDEDSVAEGIERLQGGARIAYQNLWDSLNVGRPGCAWADDPWICAISFRIIPKNIDATTGDE